MKEGQGTAYSDEEMAFLSRLVYNDSATFFDADMDIITAEDLKGMSIYELVLELNRQIEAKNNVLIGQRKFDELKDLYIFPSGSESKFSELKVSHIEEKNGWDGPGLVSWVLEDRNGPEGKPEVLVVFRGSDPITNPKDLFWDWIGSNLGLIDASDTPQQRAIAEYIERLIEKDLITGDINLNIMGHSLGGGHAAFMAIYMMGLPEGELIKVIRNYDGPGFSDAFFERYADKISLLEAKYNDGLIDSIHFQMIVGYFLNSIPGIPTIEALSSKEDFESHDLNYLSFKNGDIEPFDGERGGLVDLLQTMSEIGNWISTSETAQNAKNMFFSAIVVGSIFKAVAVITGSFASAFAATVLLFGLKIVVIAIVALALVAIGIVLVKILVEKLAKIGYGIGEWLDKNTNRDRKYVESYPYFSIDTIAFRGYGERFRSILKRIEVINSDLHTVSYSRDDDFSPSYYVRNYTLQLNDTYIMSNLKDYFLETADDFWEVEQRIVGKFNDLSNSMGEL